MRFPTDRFELLQRAERVNAPDALKVAIRGLPDARFRCRRELVDAVEALATR